MKNLIADGKALLMFVKRDGSEATSGSRNPLIREAWKGYQEHISYNPS